jgi:hypothetical protein
LSCACILILTYKLRYASMVFCKFGFKLKCSDTELKLFISKTFKPIKKLGINELTSDDVLFRKR